MRALLHVAARWTLTLSSYVRLCRNMAHLTHERRARVLRSIGDGLGWLRTGVADTVFRTVRYVTSLLSVV
jgi:hypothetical protein